MKSIAGRLVLALLTAAAVLVVVEIVFRIADVRAPRHRLRSVWLVHPEPRFLGEWQLGQLYAPSTDPRLGALRGELLPGIRYRLCYDDIEGPGFDEDGCLLVRINADNLRGPELALRKSAGTWRLAAIGDSFTFGEGVRLMDAWPAAVGRAVAASGLFPDVEVLNAGIPGFIANDSRLYLQHKVMKYAPDQIVYGFFLNDVFPGNAPDPEMVALMARVYGPPTGLGTVSRLADMIIHADHRRRLTERTETMYRESFGGAGLTADDWAETRGHILEMKAIADRNGIGFLMVIFPVLTVLGDDYPFEDVHRQVAEFCEANGIDYVDVLDTWRPERAEELRVHVTDHHPNARAHALAARVISQRIIERLRQGR
jgi:lysophospholipase L1-like esterase